MVADPKLSVIIISVLITLIMTLVTKYFTNQSRMKELKQIQKSCQIKVRENKGDAKIFEETNKQIMECSMELMKHSFKPLLFTFIPLIIFFWWIKEVYTGVFSSWIWWYIGTVIISSIVFRKTLKVV